MRIAPVQINPCNTTTGIAVNRVNSNAVNIFPNPTNGVFTITSERLKIEDLVIYNIKGQKIFSLLPSANKASVDLSNKPKGVYFYRVQNGGKIINTGKIIVE
jgi:hypothetical protein